MLISIPNVLTPEQVAQGRKMLDEAEWIDGKISIPRQNQTGLCGAPGNGRHNPDVVDGGPAQGSHGQFEEMS